MRHIISFDGGGIRGLFQAFFLQSLDLPALLQGSSVLAGTSTGAIIAAGIALGKTPSQLVSLYQQLGKDVFGSETWPPLRLLGYPKYSSDTLSELTVDYCGGKTLGQLERRLIVPAVCLNDYTLKIFDSDDPQVRKLPLSDILLASTAAPTYFRPHRFSAPNSEPRLWADGGLACNNPSMAALSRVGLTESITGRIRLLSIGNGQKPVTNQHRTFNNNNPISWSVRVQEISFKSNAEFAHEECLRILPKANYLRVNPQLSQTLELDDLSSSLELLPSLAKKFAEMYRSQLLPWDESLQNQVTANSKITHQIGH